jgi:hypothetical protein
MPEMTRKTQIDSLLKKCKSKCFKTIHDALRKCLKCKIDRLPQEFITNIKIDFNKTYMNKSILQIYKEYNIIKSVDDIFEKNLILEDKKEYFKDFFNLSFKDSYELYITSRQYLKDYEDIAEKECENFAILYNYISRIFVQYYTFSKGNRPKSNEKSRIRKIKFKKMNCTLRGLNKNNITTGDGNNKVLFQIHKQNSAPVSEEK